MNAPPPELAPALPITANGSPDWSAIEQEITCPLCGYNLRGLEQPRCPECGYQFHWPELLDLKLRQHSFVFEHHQEKNVRSFFRTAAATWRPRKFWTALKPSQASRPRRLILYWLIANLIPVLAGVIWAALNYCSNQAAAWSWLGPPTSSSGAAAFLGGNHVVYRHGDSDFPISFEWYSEDTRLNLLGNTIRYQYPSSIYLTGCALSLLVPWICFLTLLLFQGTMRRAKIGSAHVLRCVLYSCDVPLWFGLLLLIILPLAVLSRCSANLRTILNGEPFLDSGDIATALLLLPLFYAIVSSYRLYVGYRRYLQFRHAAATIFAVQVIVLLLLLCVFLVGYPPLEHYLL